MDVRPLFIDNPSSGQEGISIYAAPTLRPLAESVDILISSPTIPKGRSTFSTEEGVGKLDRSKDWMDEAEGDLEHAKSDVNQGFHNWACFSAQQSAEKAIKAVFQKMHAEAWGHSAADLLQELSKRHKVPSDLVDAALELDKAYIPTRYPNAHPSGSPRNRYTKEESKRLVSYAERILKFCSGVLSQV